MRDTRYLPQKAMGEHCKGEECKRWLFLMCVLLMVGRLIHHKVIIKCQYLTFYVMFKVHVKCIALRIIANWIETLKTYTILLLRGIAHGLGDGDRIRKEGNMHLILSIFFMVLLSSLLFTTYGWVVCAIVDGKSSMSVHIFANKRGRIGGGGYHQCQHWFVNQKQPLHPLGNSSLLEAFAKMSYASFIHANNYVDTTYSLRFARSKSGMFRIPQC